LVELRIFHPFFLPPTTEFFGDPLALAALDLEDQLYQARSAYLTTWYNEVMAKSKQPSGRSTRSTTTSATLSTHQPQVIDVYNAANRIQRAFKHLYIKIFVEQSAKIEVGPAVSLFSTQAHNIVRCFSSSFIL
jgi:hypothetical protein